MPSQESVDIRFIKALIDCISSRFDVMMENFTIVQKDVDMGGGVKMNVGGSFQGLDIVTGQNISISTNNSMYDTAAMARIAPGTEGFTDLNLPNLNFVASDLSPEQMLDAQVYELGNSLGIITNSVPNEINQSRTNEPGHDLSDCLSGPGGK